MSELNLLSKYMEYWTDHYFNTSKHIIRLYKETGMILVGEGRMTFKQWKNKNYE